mgnify:CR=1 FL=1
MEFEKLGVNVAELTYNHDEFLEIVKGLEDEKEGGNRCKICIAKRMDKTFEYAVLNNYEVVTTTLSISPHKDCEYINQFNTHLFKSP